MDNTTMTPDRLFEVSWEVCNKIGGIHTVIATKAQTVTRRLGDRYMLIGPDLSHEGVNAEFEEDASLLKAWRQSVYDDGIRIRVGRWKVKGEPIAILVDFTSLFSRKDEILKKLWEEYHVDSTSGQWDYIEPVLFGWAAGQVIASYVDSFCPSTEKVAAHFHEWMTAAGGLYLRTHSPYVATLFTTHATVIGRCIAGNRLPLYNDLAKFNADELARQFNVTAKHSIEKMAATYHDSFLTVSDITANECKYLLGREADTVTPNGFEDDIVWTGDEFAAKRAEARRAMIGVAEAALGTKFAGDPLIVGTSGRYEWRNKGLDVFLESLKQLAASEKLDREVLVYITVPAANRGPRLDLRAHVAEAGRSVAIPLLDALSRVSGQRSDRQFAARQRARGPRLESQGALRADLSEQGRRHLQQGLLRTAGGHGHDRLRLLLRAVGLYAAGVGGLLGADAHHVAGRLRHVGVADAAPSGRHGRPPRRL